MAEIKVPELAESITEGTIAKWLKNIGESIEKGDYLVELETDKVNIEIISDYSGTIKEQKFGEGDTVKVGETIAIVDETVSETVTASEVKQEPVKVPGPQIEKTTPEAPTVSNGENKSKPVSPTTGTV
ncbi:MAG: biotin/lipoyl-containing protein, partial [Neobacillus sp.]